MDARRAAAAASTAALLAIAGFTALGSVFDYPKILKEPTADILALYHAHQGAVTAWFLVLMVGAGLLAPVGIFLSRVGRDPRIAWWGTAAAAVQVIGLSRWVLLVPGIGPDDHRRFELFHFWLGTILGETIGYALTAVFTVLVTRAVAPRLLRPVGYVAAGLIATGVLVPLGLDAATLSNFAGYVLWCLWLLVLSYWLWTTQTREASSARIR